MGRISPLLLSGVTVILILSGINLEATECKPEAPGAPEDYDDYEDTFILPPDNRHFDEFDWQLCKMLHNKEPGNIVVSPIGIKVLLVLLLEGAQGNTAEELRQVLRLNGTRLQTRKHFEFIINSLQTCQPDYSLELGTRIFVSKDVKIYKGFSKRLRLYYGADTQNVDFLETEQAANTINNWVNNSTHGRITSLLNPNEIQPSTVLILLNAIFFLGTWKYPFSRNDFKTGPFHISPEKSVTVTYMTQDRYLYYSESVELDAKILRLPYKGKKYSMFIVLPQKPDGLAQLVNKINPFLLRTHLSTMEQSSVHIMLPRFKFDFTVDLGKALKEMGLNDVFDERANLPGLLRRLSSKQYQNQSNEEIPNVYVSKVMQRAGIEVNENGTVAYGTTSMTIENKFGGQDYEFHATHPFIFFIEDESTGVAVFVGKVTNPEASPSSR